jgi:hypothetical protein
VKPVLKGQILYDPEAPYTINVATTAAGLREAAVSATDLGLPMLLDLRHRWGSAAEAYAWAASSLLPTCNRDRAALLPAEAVSMRDLAIQESMFTFEPPGSEGGTWFDDILTRLPPGTAIYGETPAAALPALSRSSHFFVPGSQAANLSFLSGSDADPRFYQYFGYVDPGAPRYLAFIFDCSDLGFATNKMPGLWDRSTRGSLPLGWAIPAAMAQVAPSVLHAYYADAYRFGIDNLLLGPSGAGEMDVSAASAPFTFFRATRTAVDSLDAHVLLYAPPPDIADLGPAISRFAGETGTQGAFVLAPPDFEPALFDGIPVIAAPRVDSVADAVTYLDRIPLDRRFAALCLDAGKLTPADAAHIAAHVARRYVVVTPEQMVDLMRMPTQASQPGPATAAVTSVDYPMTVDPDAAVPIKAVIESQGPIQSAAVLYQAQLSQRSFYEPMHPAEGGYQAQLPPLRCGGEISLSIRVIDSAGRAAWSPTWKIEVPRTDSDGDGLSDSEESFLLTDPKNPDTDGDGLLDGNDPTPLRFDRVVINYLGPIYPPSDATYAPEPGATSSEVQGRLVRPGQTCTYWLPLGRVAPGAPAVIGLEASGPAAISVSTDGTAYAEQFNGDLSGVWHSPAVPVPHTGGVFMKVACPAGAVGDLLVRAFGAFTTPDAPSVGSASVSPAHPGPEQSVVVSGVVFSPSGIADVSLTYRVNNRGEITIPMQAMGSSQRYAASIPALENRDELEWWITARDKAGSVVATAPAFLPIGSRARDSAALLSTREFVGNWSASSDWDGAGRQAFASGLSETAPANLTEGSYSVWILAGGRGQGIAVYVGDRRVGGIDPDKPDGWQQVGRVKLDSARHLVRVVSEENPRGPVGAAPRYADVILSADTTFRPPSDQVLDIYNSLVLLSPRTGDTLSGRVDLLATGAGNVTAVEFSLDGQLLHRVSGPPFPYSVNTERIANGAHTLKVAGFDRTGSTGLELSIPVTVANQRNAG